MVKKLKLFRKFIIRSFLIAIRFKLVLKRFRFLLRSSMLVLNYQGVTRVNV